MPLDSPPAGAVTSEQSLSTPVGAQPRPRPRSRRLAVAVAALLLATGCSTGADDNQVPRGLISADEVGGTPLQNAARKVASAGPDDIGLVGGARSSNTAGYRLPSGETVLIVAQERTATSVRAGMAYLAGCLDLGDCHAEPLRFTATRLEAFDGSIAFASSFTTRDNDRVSIKRSYTYLQADPAFDGTLVMVSVERTGADVRERDLRRITRAQVAETRASAE